MHVVLHAPLPQTYGAHALVAEPQLPRPLHVESVCVPPVHVLVAHTVPDA